MFSFLNAAVLAAIAISTSAVSAVASPTINTKALDSALTASIADSHIPAATVLVSVDGKIVYSRGFGMRDIRTSSPADASTHYEIGSMTKQFTAAAILQLQEAGKLSIDDSVEKYLPNAPHAHELTLRQLLTQRSGLFEYLRKTGIRKRLGTPGNYDAIVATVAGKPLAFRPASKHEYSNTNYIVLGRIVEVVSHEPYERYVREHEWVPVGMTETSWIADEPHIPNMALGYTVTAAAKLVPSPPLNDGWAWSAGAIVSTVVDFEKWMDALASGKVVSPKDFELMTSASLATHDTGDDYYAYGLMISRVEGQPEIWHNGGTLGFRSDGAYFPRQHTHIIVLTNSGNASPEAIALKLLYAFHPELLLRPAPGEDVGLTERFKKVLLSLLAGNVDRSQMTAKEATHMSDAHVKDENAQLAHLGPLKAFVFKGARKSASWDAFTYLVQFAHVSYTFIIGTEPTTGKISTMSHFL